METYGLMCLAGSGETYALAYDDTGIIIGVCGPIYYGDIPGIEFECLDYDRHNEAIVWVQAHNWRLPQ